MNALVLAGVGGLDVDYAGDAGIGGEIDGTVRRLLQVDVADHGAIGRNAEIASAGRRPEDTQLDIHGAAEHA